MSSIGYGPSAPGAQEWKASIPMFDGRLEHFEDFKYKAKAVFLELGLEDVTFKPFAEIAYAREKLVKSALASPGKKHAEVAVDFKEQLALFDKKVAQVARLLISRLIPSVAERLRKTLPEEKHFDGCAIWDYLQITYGSSKLATNVAANAEKNILDVLKMQWNKTTLFSSHLRMVKAKLAVITSSKRITGSPTARNIVTSLIIRDLLDRISDQPRYRSIHERFFEEMVGKDSQFTEQSFDELFTAVEKVDLAQASADKSTPQQRPIFKSQHKDAVASSQRTNPIKPAPLSEHRKGTASAARGKPPRVHSVQSMGDDIIDEEPVNIDAYLSPIVNHAQSLSSKSGKIFLIDSGATHHCVREKGLFSKFRPGKHVVKVADGKTIVATGKGQEVVLNVSTSVEGEVVQMTLHDTFFVPGLTNNIFSTNKFVGAGKDRNVTLGEVKALHVDGSKVIPLHQEHGLVWLMTARQSAKKAADDVQSKGLTSVEYQLFHERCGHLNLKDCQRLAAQQGIRLLNAGKGFCNICATSKQRKQPIADLAERETVRPGQIIHCDIKGPLEHTGYNKARYALVVVDEATRIMAAKPMRSKDKSVNALQSIIKDFAAVNLSVGKDSIFHSDSEVVLKSKGMTDYLASLQVKSRSSPPHTPERNGIAERAIQTIFNTTRAMLQESKLEQKFWPVALEHAVYLRNRSPTAALGGRSPLEELTGKPASVAHLKRSVARCLSKLTRHRVKLWIPSREKACTLVTTMLPTPSAL